MKRKLGRPKGSYKYSIDQMWHYAYSSRNKKKLQYWYRRLNKQRIKVYQSEGMYIQSRRLKARSEEIIKYRLIFGPKKKIWITATHSDVADLTFTGTFSKNNDKLMLLNENNEAILIAYEGTDVYNAAVRARREYEIDE